MYEKESEGKQYGKKNISDFIGFYIFTFFSHYETTKTQKALKEGTQKTLCEPMETKHCDSRGELETK